MAPFSNTARFTAGCCALLLTVSVIPVRVCDAQGQRARTAADFPQRLRTALTREEADSLYQRARELLNRRDLTAAAELFERVAREAPQSRNAPNALYWRGYALYQLYLVAGDYSALALASASLTDHIEQYPWSATKTDAFELLDRVKTAFAAAGDVPSRNAMARQRAGYREGMGCAGARDTRTEDLALYRQFETSDSAATNALSGELVVAVMRGFSSGPGLCADISRYTPLYWKLRQFQHKDMLIRVFGHSLHPSATTALAEIVNRETNERLRTHAREWLDKR